VQERQETPAAPAARIHTETVPPVRRPAATSLALPTPPARDRPPAMSAKPRRVKRGDVALIVIAALAVVLMLMVPFAADWIWPSVSPVPVRPKSG